MMVQDTTQVNNMMDEIILAKPRREKPRWNIIEEEDFKNQISDVFEAVSGALSKTLGPYGSTTILEKYGEMHITKDGWQVLKKIHFENPVHNNILNLLLNISAQVVIKVGDGSTSSIMSANSLLHEMRERIDLTAIRPKEFITKLNGIVDRIATRIREASTKITDTKDIYKMALISTNGDEEIASIIKDIYDKTGNPTIQFVQSKTNKTSYEIVEGYQMPFMTYLDGIFVNREDGTCVVKEPIMLLFDHRIDREVALDKIILPVVQKALSEQRRIVVVAPQYDKFLLDYLATTINLEMRASKTTNIVYSRVSLVNKMNYTLFNDFATLTGGALIKETHLDGLIDGSLDINDFIGTVDSITIGKDNTHIKGLSNKDEAMYDILMKDAVAKCEELQEKHRELNVVNSDVYELKQRISKLRCNMGIINVGGHSSLEKVSNYDLVDDAVKACESAYTNGYNIGGNLIIPITIQKMINSEDLTDEEEIILEMISNAFRNVFKRVLKNRYTRYDDEPLEIIVSDCVMMEKCYDLIKEEYSTEIINSCYTDIEILKAATSIVSLLISSNQYISIHVPVQE